MRTSTTACKPRDKEAVKMAVKARQVFDRFERCMQIEDNEDLASNAVSTRYFSIKESTVDMLEEMATLPDQQQAEERIMRLGTLLQCKNNNNTRLPTYTTQIISEVGLKMKV